MYGASSGRILGVSTLNRAQKPGSRLMRCSEAFRKRIEGQHVIADPFLHIRTVDDLTSVKLDSLRTPSKQKDPKTSNFNEMSSFNVNKFNKRLIAVKLRKAPHRFVVVPLRAFPLYWSHPCSTHQNQNHSSSDTVICKQWLFWRRSCASCLAENTLDFLHWSP